MYERSSVIPLVLSFKSRVAFISPENLLEKQLVSFLFRMPKIGAVLYPRPRGPGFTCYISLHCNPAIMAASMNSWVGILRRLIRSRASVPYRSFSLSNAQLQILLSAPPCIHPDTNSPLSLSSGLEQPAMSRLIAIPTDAIVDFIVWSPTFWKVLGIHRVQRQYRDQSTEVRQSRTAC